MTKFRTGYAFSASRYSAALVAALAAAVVVTFGTLIEAVGQVHSYL